MIPQHQLNEIKAFLDTSKSPLFFFDDDCDGVCSYLLLKKINNRGKGVIIKSNPELGTTYEGKVNELCPDKIFVLDKPMISQEFIDAVNKPIIWIDHHPPVKREKVIYFNPMLENGKDNRPTSYWCYKVNGNEKDLWLATVGCVSDWFVPEFAKDFSEKYPDLLPEFDQEPGHIIFKTELGKLIRLISFLLKGKTSDVRKNINILSNIESPYEITNQTTSKGKFLFMYSKKINKAYDKLLEKARKTKLEGKLLLFTYPDSKTSFTSELSNELMHEYPDKIIVVGRIKKEDVILSLRSQKEEISSKLEKALQNIKGYGGGHSKACGACICKEDFHSFIENFKSQLTK